MSALIALRLKKLKAGMRLRQTEFHRLYEAYPEDVKFELIQGEVHMASPASDGHGEGVIGLAAVFFIYSARTPGLAARENVTTILGWDSEPQPDLILRVLSEYGGQVGIDHHDYIVGAPELVCEVSRTTLRNDLGPKRDMYERYGVREYIVHDVVNGVLHWHCLPGRAIIEPDSGGIAKSTLFPGLWIDVDALVRGDKAALLAAIDAGTKSAAHKRFAAQMRKLKAPPS